MRPKAALVELQEQSASVMQRLIESSERLEKTLANGVPSIGELERAIEELLTAHGDNCSGCVRARALLLPPAGPH